MNQVSVAVKALRWAMHQKVVFPTLKQTIRAYIDRPKGETHAV